MKAFWPFSPDITASNFAKMLSSLSRSGQPRNSETGLATSMFNQS
jgi:hypothetical protein